MANELVQPTTGGGGTLQLPSLAVASGSKLAAFLLVQPRIGAAQDRESAYRRVNAGAVIRRRCPVIIAGAFVGASGHRRGRVLAGAVIADRRDVVVAGFWISATRTRCRGAI